MTTLYSRGWSWEFDIIQIARTVRIRPSLDCIFFFLLVVFFSLLLDASFFPLWALKGWAHSASNACLQMLRKTISSFDCVTVSIVVRI
ncbi:hypothetical protein P168DRAFT_571 [Aspergillus campestris IBT 28561]|uniref:Uncharacterized protein n=1 Tax=Aspergillus campestris (strain IBT 28561) TaxID=1392248 RepID=A0A2I1DCS8_ASPC2|nr:uncharacterized protein P168DRAFT_571 [Aspergillus campestris IBT 28561]PKY07688.1 hypothetical protein P168DRAFT_571 [Aspergillus campestris IBT 28561]